MNKDNAKDYLPLVQALAEGKVIQFFTSGSRTWGDLDDTYGVSFTYGPERYRIKPEPKVLFAVYSIGGVYQGTYHLESTARGWADTKGGSYKKFVEVEE